MEQTSRDNKKHIGFFGRCNVGKSTLVNALTGQEISIVSDKSGTTTDSVKKSMELFGYGAVTVIDTAGLDDDTELGRQRVKASMHSLSLVDLAVLVISRNTFSDLERDFIKQCSRYDVPVIAVYNKTDLEPLNPILRKELQNNDEIIFHELKDHTKASMDSLTGRMAEVLSANETAQKTLLEDIVKKGDVVLLVTPIDSSAPKGRMILPQVQMTREVAAACEAIIEAGHEVVVRDGHETARNIIHDMLPYGVKLMRGWACHPGSMMAGISDKYAGALYIGYHSPAGSDESPLAHTMNVHKLMKLEINGRLASEFTLNSLYAAEKGVPSIFISGDAGICRRAAEEIEGTPFSAA